MSTLEKAQKEEYTLQVVPFVLWHVAAVIGLFTVESDGYGTGALLCVGFYYLRMFGITAGYHRYFSHRAFRTSRGFQFILALLGTLSMQKGVLWWAAHHRDHHKLSDTDQDIHSPIRRGWFWAHMGWFLSQRHNQTKLGRIKDFAKFPELRFLDRHCHIIPIAASVILYLIAGWDAFVWIALVSTVLLWHGTFTINSLAHLWGRQRYETKDESRNSFLLALLTMGEGWHNNHHHYQSTASQGFFWWEVDFSYYALKVLSWTGLVWDLRAVPEHIRRGEAKRGRLPKQASAHP